MSLQLTPIGNLQFKAKLQLVVVLNFLTLTGFFLQVHGQSVTTSSLSGTVYSDSTKTLSDVVIIAEHIPSATRYATISFAGGKYVLPSLRIGGPYRITAKKAGYPEVVSYIKELSSVDYFGYTIHFNRNVISLKEVAVKEERRQVFKNDATSFSISSSLINKVPTITRGLKDLIRLSPFAFGLGVIGTNPRLNNFTIDGSLLITYGLGSTIVVGNTTGTDPIGLDAIEQLQINVAPFDVRQSGFTSAGINIITKKGDNTFQISAFDYFNMDKLNGKNVNGERIERQAYRQYQKGFNASGAIVKNKLFYRFSYENRFVVGPVSNFVANVGTPETTNSTRVLSADLDGLSRFLKNSYQYVTGPYQDYNSHINNDKLVGQMDWNLSKNSSLALRVLYLNSYQDKILSNDNSVGMGARNNNLFSMSYQNSNYVRHSNALSVRLAYNSQLSRTISQEFNINYSSLPDYRKQLGELKPLVDILKDSRNYISFGSDIFAQNNKLNTNIYQLQEHLTFHLFKHNFLAGFDASLIDVKNTFTPVYQGYYLFNSLSDFYNSVPAGTPTPIGFSSGLMRPSAFGKGYSLLPHEQIPTFNFGYAETGIYLQDNWEISNWFNIMPGIRLDRYYFIGNPGSNPKVSTLFFQKPSGSIEELNTGRLPSDQYRFSPRIGFTLRIKQIENLKIHGGIGVFSGRLPMVLLGEQFRNNGLLTSNFYTQKTAHIPFQFSPEANASVAQKQNASYDIVLLDKKFKYPQTIKNNLSFNLYLKRDWVLSLEGLYNNDISSFYVRNANIDNTQFDLNANGRIRLLNSTLNGPIVQHAYVVDNISGGRQYAISLNARKSFRDDFTIFLNYTYGNSKDMSSFAGTEPASEFINEAVVNNPNRPKLAYSAFDQRHRIFVFLAKSYHFSKNSTTSFSSIAELSQNGRFSYTYAGNDDVNGDGVPGNDMIFVPASQGQINLLPYTNANGALVSAADQWQSLQQFIKQSAYLRKRQGQFAERNGNILPFNFQMDVKLLHEFKLKEKQVFQFSLDCINLPNLINSYWGVKYLPSNIQPIEAVTYDSFRVYPANLGKEYTPDPSLLSIWQLQIGIKYSF